MVKRVELAVAKMKNTGANINHVFTSRCAKKREMTTNYLCRRHIQLNK